MMLNVATQGEKLKRLRRGRALTQAALSESAGVSSRTVLLLEADRTEARPSTLKKLADALNVDPMELVGDE